MTNSSAIADERRHGRSGEEVEAEGLEGEGREGAAGEGKAGCDSQTAGARFLAPRHAMSVLNK